MGDGPHKSQWIKSRVSLARLLLMLKGSFLDLASSHDEQMTGLGNKDVNVKSPLFFKVTIVSKLA
ncbi:hypothetical protein Hanom_Chr05g00462261 [Helianthus anomalus]